MRFQVTVIPVTLALSSRTPARQKLALAGIFSLSLIVTIFSIICFSLNAPDRPPADPSWIGAWSTIEHSVSVTVACLASFRVYVIDKRRKLKSAPSLVLLVHPSPRGIVIPTMGYHFTKAQAYR